MKKELNAISNKTNFLLNFMFLLYTLACIGPLLLILGVSLTDEKVVFEKGYHLIPEKFSLSAYEYIFGRGEMVLRSYGVSIFVTLVGTALSMLIIAFFAYPISRKDFAFKKHFSFFVFFTMIFNGGLVPWYIMYAKYLHMKDSIWVLIVPYLMNAWYVMIMRTFFATSIPDSLIESAKIDGAGEWRTFFSIIIPLSKPGLATIGLFSTLGYWNDYWLPLVFITKKSLFNLQFAMYTVLNNIQYLIENASRMRGNVSVMNVPSETSRMAMCIVAIGPIIFAYPFFQKYFIKGLTVGAVKG